MGLKYARFSRGEYGLVSKESRKVDMVLSRKVRMFRSRAV